MTSISAGHIILTPTHPVGSGRPQRGSNPDLLCLMIIVAEKRGGGGEMGEKQGEKERKSRKNNYIERYLERERKKS